MSLQVNCSFETLHNLAVDILLGLEHPLYPFLRLDLPFRHENHLESPVQMDSPGSQMLLLEVAEVVVEMRILEPLWALILLLLGL